MSNNQLMNFVNKLRKKKKEIDKKEKIGKSYLNK